MQMESNFIKTIIEEDLKSGKHKKIITRFPPEPNGFLHIGHARAIIINFELAKEFGGITNLRFDDTNPEGENKEYVNNIIEDVKWLGYEPNEILFASDYFDFFFEQALVLIKKGLAYVDKRSAEVIASEKGDIYTPGINSPYRDTSVEENLKLFLEMKDGKHEPGSMVLRAKIDMKSPNMNMRDPAFYRIVNFDHYRIGDGWNIYPLYDFAHPLEDAKEHITHSLCSLEFEDHRPLYDWFVDNCDLPSKPRQIEFGRLNIENTLLSKRYLKELVEKKLVTGWDDPRMPTIKGFRRKGYTKEAIRNFILSAGLSKANSVVGKDMLESFIRDDLSLKAKPVMAVSEPLKVTITNFEGKDEVIEAPYFGDKEDSEKRNIYFGKELYIEKEDFVIEKPNKKYKRLYLGGEVRLMNAYFIRCNDYKTDKEGNIIELLCTYDKATKSGSGFNERKPNGTIHFVSASNSVPTEFRYFNDLVDPSLGHERPADNFNKNSIIVHEGFVEKSVKDSKVGDHYQFVRKGYYTLDKDTTKEKLVFNETVALKASYK